MFDVNKFEAQEHAEVADSTFTPYPAGDYTAQIGVEEADLKFTTGEKNGRPWAIMALRCWLADPSGTIAKVMGAPRNANGYAYTYRIMLDLAENATVEEPILDFSPNRNLELGRVQEATGNNQKGWKFSAFRGRKFKLRLEIGPRKDKPELMENKVTAVSAA
jgi:hypothetical protein